MSNIIKPNVLSLLHQACGYRLLYYFYLMLEAEPASKMPCE